MGQSFYNKLLNFVFTAKDISSEDISENTRLRVNWLENIQLLATNLFISTPVESAQDVTEHQFGFIIDSIAGELIEVNKDEKMDVEKGKFEYVGFW